MDSKHPPAEAAAATNAVKAEAALEKNVKALESQQDARVIKLAIGDTPATKMGDACVINEAADRHSPPELPRIPPTDSEGRRRSAYQLGADDAVDIYRRGVLAGVEQQSAITRATVIRVREKYDQEVEKVIEAVRETAIADAKRMYDDAARAKREDADRSKELLADLARRQDEHERRADAQDRSTVFAVVFTAVACFAIGFAGGRRAPTV